MMAKKSPRKRRRLLYILTALSVCLIAGFVYVYFISTRAVLNRAETFEFRRMRVNQINDRGACRFFYATNRNEVPGNDAVAGGFGTLREYTVKFGYFDTEVEPSLGLGMIINPTEWFQNEEIRLLGVNALERPAFVSQARDMVRRSPRTSLLVVVHGFREAFESALRKTAFVGHMLDVNTPVLLFDWPGNQGSTLRGYRSARRVARESGTELARVLELIIREVQPASLWVIANSMGAQVVTHAIALLHAQEDLADAQAEIEDIVLTAPDVSREEFNQTFKRQMQDLARDLTVYVSSNDRALLVSRVLNLGRRLGESTLSTLNPDQSGETAAVIDMIDANDERVTLVDVTPVNRTRNFHNFSLETPEFFDDLFLRLSNENTPQNRLLYPVRTPDDRVYWVLTRGR